MPRTALLRRFGVTMGGLPFSGIGLARLATDPAFAGAGAGGTYWQARDGTLTQRRSSAASCDAAAGRRLWDDCLAMAG